MTKNYLFYLFLFLGMYSCTEEQIATTSFTISARHIATDSYLRGGEYRILDANKEIIATYIFKGTPIEVKNLKAQSYTIQEVSAPKGYVALQKEKTHIYSRSNVNNFVFIYTKEGEMELPEKVKLTLYATDYNYFLGDYDAVRIGEYYWVDRNFSHRTPYGDGYENDVPITQNTLNKYLPLAKIDISKYQLDNISDFEKYYGRYYGYASILYMNRYCYMRNRYNEKEAGWKLPSPEDYRQLFAMCPFNATHDRGHTDLNERDVRFALSPKPNQNPLAFNIDQLGPYDVYWFDGTYNTNIHSFGLMPSGARLNGDGPWCNNIGCYNGLRGDIYGLFYAAFFAVDNPRDNLAIGAAILHDYVDTKEILLYHYMSVRWCRRLTDVELGYKLYINPDLTDIKKMSLTESAPEGYQELPHGYIRGFYVHYILNNPNPKHTVRDIVGYARNVQDNHVKENKHISNIIL